MEDREVDVLVIGGGPGGSSAARFAAENGLDTLMIEKRQEIGTPVRCGEGIARIWLDELGIKPDPSWVSHEVDGARMISPSGYILTMDERVAGNECGFVVRRDIFDKSLAMRAARAGARIMMKTLATGLIIEDGVVRGAKCDQMGETFDVRAKVTIGADGFESKVGRWAGIDTTVTKDDVNICFQYLMVGIDIDPRYNDFYMGSNIAPGGYVWVFCKGEDRANVGLGVNLAHIWKEPPGAAKRYLDKFIASRPEFAKGTPIEENAGAISCGMPPDDTIAPGLMLVGDSARHIDPLTGGGVANACMGGMHAGNVAKLAIDKGDVSKEFLMEYDTRWRESFENQMLRNFLAKTKALQLSDETFDKLIDAMSTEDLNKVTTWHILKAVEKKYPELVEELKHLL
jgi:digeranylgeranylglycerophospholipid reductase